LKRSWEIWAQRSGGRKSSLEFGDRSSEFPNTKPLTPNNKKHKGAKMTVVIRLKRIGAPKKPSNRIVVADNRRARDGRNIEEIGFYDPTRNPPVVKIDRKKYDYWVGVGAQPSHAVKNLVKKAQA